MFAPNISKILYLAFRLAPFIIVCFFVLESILYRHINGIIYLVGILVSCMITVIVGKLYPNILDVSSSSTCNSLNIGQDGMALSDLPLSIVILSFTVSYLIRFMFYVATQPGYNINEVIIQQLPTIIIFPLLILIDGIWNSYNSCFSLSRVLVAFGLGCGLGIGWASIMVSSGNPHFMYFDEMSDAVICKKPMKTKFKCVTKTIP